MRKDENNEIRKGINKKTSIILIVIGAIIELIGLGLEIFSFVMMSTGSFENFMWIGFVAIPVMFVGAVFLILGLMRPMSKFAARTSAPIQKDYMNYMREETVDTAKEYYKDIASGIREGTDEQETIECKQCKHLNKKDSKFCNNCGNKLNHEIKCTHCGKITPSDSKYCNNCGEKLD